MGNVEPFFAKLNTIITQPNLHELSSQKDVLDDVESVQMKQRKGKLPIGPNVVVEDSHRPDTVLVTRPKKRKYPGLVGRDPNLRSTMPPHELVNLSSNGSPHEPMNLSSDGSHKSFKILDNALRPSTRS